MNDDDKPATKRDLREAFQELKTYVIERENALIWKVIALQVTLIGAIAAAQWAAITFVLTHWKPTP
jgi:hypothetical protein